MKKFDTILFDLDGTLIDTNEIIIKSYQHAFKTHLPDLEISRETIIKHIGPTLKTIFSLYATHEALVGEMIKTYRTYYKKHEHAHFKLYDGVIETLEVLKSKRINLAIVTSKLKEAAWPSFTYYALDRYFDVFVALDDVSFPKPDKEPVLKALSHFKDAKNILMVGDNQSDILAGINAGVMSAGVAWSIKGRAHLEKAKPTLMLESMQALLNYI